MLTLTLEERLSREGKRGCLVAPTWILWDLENGLQKKDCGACFEIMIWAKSTSKDKTTIKIMTYLWY